MLTLRELDGVIVKQNVKVHIGSVSLTVWAQTRLMALNLILHWEVCDGGEQREGRQPSEAGLCGVLLERSLVLSDK